MRNLGIARYNLAAINIAFGADEWQQLDAVSKIIPFQGAHRLAPPGSASR